jgi:protein-tyrosine phosphatase
MSIVDFHNHLIPGVDDGAQTLAESEEGVAAFVANGVGGFVATPHVDAELTHHATFLNARLAEIDEGWAALSAMCAVKFPEVSVYRAVELLLDVPEPDLSDDRLRINGGEFLLVEFPFMTVPPHSTNVLRRLSDTGVIPVLAHPERYRGVTSLDIAGEWKDAGALLQVNGGSLLGRYGPQARSVAFDLLQRGWVDYLCSDYHARGEPLIRDYEDLLGQCEAAEQAHTLMRTNPERLLAGQRPLPVPPMRTRGRGVWARVSGLFK